MAASGAQLDEEILRAIDVALDDAASACTNARTVSARRREVPHRSGAGRVGGGTHRTGDSNLHSLCDLNGHSISAPSIATTFRRLA